MKTRIIDICIEIIKILEIVNEKKWLLIFMNFIKELNHDGNKSIYREILKIYGGMGSFNDLVLFKDSKICKEENNKLDNLRQELYNELIIKMASDSTSVDL